MVSIKFQMERIHTGEKAHLCNQSVKSKLKTFVHRTHKAAVVGDRIAAEPALRIATRKLDVAASKGAIHKDQAAQRKSEPVISMATMNQPSV